MNTKILMTAAALFNGALGIILSFLPAEVLTAVESQPSRELMLIVQITGALFFASGMVNWMSRENLLGGIYGRAVVIGNLTHYIIGALALIKDYAAAPTVTVLPFAVIYTAFAVAFSYLMNTTPSQKNESV
jgi:uncharacterized membrane protein